MHCLDIPSLRDSHLISKRPLRIGKLSNCTRIPINSKLCLSRSNLALSLSNTCRLTTSLSLSQQSSNLRLGCRSTSLDLHHHTARLNHSIRCTSTRVLDRSRNLRCRCSLPCSLSRCCGFLRLSSQCSHLRLGCCGGSCGTCIGISSQRCHTRLGRCSTRLGLSNLLGHLR